MNSKLQCKNKINEVINININCKYYLLYYYIFNLPKILPKISDFSRVLGIIHLCVDCKD